MNLLKKIILAMLALAIGFLYLQIYQLKHSAQGNFGATIPTVVALFETSLASNITSTQSTMTLVSGTDKQGNSLSGTYGFIIDEGSASEEFVICTASGTALSACTRGISVTDGKTAVTALQKSHRRGSSIKITNYPQLAILSRILNASESVPNKIYYPSAQDFTTASSSVLVDKNYVDSGILAGCTNATLTIKGCVERATVAEINAGTGLGGTGARLFMNPSDFASSSYGTNILSDSQFAAIPGLLASPSASNKFLTQQAFTINNQWLAGSVFKPGDLLIGSTTGFTKLASAGSSVSNFALIASDSAAANMAWEPLVRWQWISKVSTGSAHGQSTGDSITPPAGATTAIVHILMSDSDGVPNMQSEVTVFSTGKTAATVATVDGVNTNTVTATWSGGKIVITGSGTVGTTRFCDNDISDGGALGCWADFFK